jgi:hypothetical protein
MAPNGPIRFYATFKTTPDLLAATAAPTTKS